jgi:hypothetical protein
MALINGSGFLEKILRFHALRWSNGKLSLFNIPGFFHAVYVNVYQQKLMEKLHGEKATADFFYSVGKFQGIQGFRTIARNFGFDKVVRNKRKLLEMQTEQSSVVGLGNLRWVRIDLNKQLFVFRGRSIFAEEYKSFFGLQEKPVCHLIRGMTAGFL